VIKDYPLKAGRFDRDKTDLLLRITKGTTTARSTCGGQPAVSSQEPARTLRGDNLEQHIGQTWQRFSRHFSPRGAPGLTISRGT